MSISGLHRNAARRVAVSLSFVGALAISAWGQTPPVPRPVYPSLGESQRAKLEGGEPVQILESLATSPWPRSIVFVFIEATTEECAAVLSDYELQAKYLPRTSESRIVRRLSPVETDVQYVIEVPLFSAERSVSREHLSTVEGGFVIRWHTEVGDADRPSSVARGQASFVAMTNSRSGKKGTLMVYDQSVVPGSIFARVPYVRNKAIEAGRELARAIGRQVESERTGDPRLLARQVARLRVALQAAPDSSRSNNPSSS